MNNFREDKNKFESDIEDALRNEKISYGTALILSDMDKQERIEIYKLLDKIHLGANKMKEVVENIYEISKRDDLKVGDILKNVIIIELLSKEDVGKKRKGEQLRKVLSIMRYPLLSKKKEIFLKKVKDLKFPQNIKIEPNENFETEKIVIKISVTNAEELKKSISEIDKKIDYIKELFLFAN